MTVLNFVDGREAPAADGRTSELVDPATGVVSDPAVVSGESDVDDVMITAWRAFQDWRRTSPAARQLALLKLADTLEAQADRFADVECAQTGKPGTWCSPTRSPNASARCGSSPVPRAFWRAPRPHLAGPP